MYVGLLSVNLILKLLFSETEWIHLVLMLHCITLYNETSSSSFTMRITLDDCVHTMQMPIQPGCTYVFIQQTQTFPQTPKFSIGIQTELAKRSKS